MTKLDKDGFVEEFNYSDINTVFIDYEYIDFLMYCILCGCDYYKMNKMGSKKAKSLMDKSVKNTKGQTSLCKMVHTLKEINKISIGEDRKVGKAALMFLRSRAFSCSLNETTIVSDIQESVCLTHMVPQLQDLADFLLNNFDINFDTIY